MTDSPPDSSRDPSPDARPDARSADPRARVVIVTGPAGAGRSTAVRALEDLGFEVIDNLPFSLLPRVLGDDGAPLPTARPLALGLDARNRDFSPATLMAAIDAYADRPDVQLLYLDCADEVLLRRFSETRRPHPLGERPADGIARDRAALAPVRDRADILIDTTALTPHELRAAIARAFGPDDGAPLSVSVESFSYKRGLPTSLDMAFDVRFLRNPHWDAALRPLDGRDPRVAAYVAADPRHADALARITDLVLSLLPAYRDEGRAHLAIGIGCTGGQHRSVCVATSLAEALAAAGWPVSLRHRELERRQGAAGLMDAPGRQT